MKIKPTLTTALSVVLYALIIGFFGGTGCEKKETPPPLPTEGSGGKQIPSTPPNEKLTDIKRNFPEIKGFVLGMSRDNAQRNLNRLGFPTFEKLENWDQVKMPNNGGFLSCGYSTNGTLFCVKMDGAMIWKLFDSRNLSAKEFAQNFTENYNIPKLSVLQHNELGFPDNPITSGPVIHNGGSERMMTIFDGWGYYDENLDYCIIIGVPRRAGYMQIISLTYSFGGKNLPVRKGKFD